MHDLEATLVAVGTAPGRGGIGCLRLSGPAAEPIARRLFRAQNLRELPHAGNRLYFGQFVDAAGQALDHGYLVLFHPRRAYTGESSAELWSHGSPAVLAELVGAALKAGATAAGPGEFTYRAVRNGRLDLARAEAVRDLIEARTGYQARVAFSQAEGAISRRLRPLCERLEEWIARIEAAVEFVDESDTQLPGNLLGESIAEMLEQCRGLLDGYRAGRVVRTGATMAIVGRPNVGKSSLFNRLLERERAIVTEIAGTTRDTLEEQIELSGIPVRLVDTAGLRDVADPIESEGVRRARLAREEADLVLLVLDRSEPLHPEEHEALQRAGSVSERSRTVVVRNKADLPAHPMAVPAEPPPLDVSAETGGGMARLREEMTRRLVGNAPLEDPIITNARHGASIAAACGDLEQAAGACHDGLPEELVLEDLRRARGHIGEIRGEFTDEALYDRIFSTFCIGK